MTIRVPQIETQLLIGYLRNVADSATVTYDQISQAVGYIVTDPLGRGRLASARRHLMREEQRVFGTIRDVGLKSLTDTETVQSGGRKLVAVRSAARRARRITLSVRDYATLSAVDKSRQTAVVAVASAVEAVASRKAVDALMRPTVTPMLDFRTLIEAMGQNKAPE